MDSVMLSPFLQKHAKKPPPLLRQLTRRYGYKWIQMKSIFLILLLISPLVISGEIYKCKNTNGQLGFSDKPCNEDATQERVILSTSKTDWIGRLKSEKSSSINITDILHNNGDYFIKYEFSSKPDSNNFIRLANKLSGMNTSLINFIEPKEIVLGRAEIKVSNKSNSLLDKLNRAKN